MRSGARDYRSEERLFNEIVNKMTNHERNHWARAGYLGLRSKRLEKLRPHAGAAIRRIQHGVGRPVGFAL